MRTKLKDKIGRTSNGVKLCKQDHDSDDDQTMSSSSSRSLTCHNNYTITTNRSPLSSGAEFFQKTSTCKPIQASTISTTYFFSSSSSSSLINSVMIIFVSLLVFQSITAVYPMSDILSTSNHGIGSSSSNSIIFSSRFSRSLSSASNLRCGVSEFACKDGSKCVPRDYLCNDRQDCPDWSDEKECKCDESEFQCPKSDGRKCLRKDWVCDDFPDCSDGSDEKGCQKNRTCTQDEFTCVTDRTCVPKTLLCDDRIDCGDGSDESNCSEKCGEGEKQCRDGLCVDASFWCDTIADCFDRSDERDCPKILCHQDQFTCLSGEKCIPRSSICDGNMDCRDESDELECPLSNSTSHQMTDGFECHDKTKRVPKSFHCDGEVDCDDKSDELNCSATTNCTIDEFKCNSTNNCISRQFRCNGMVECQDGSDEEGCHHNMDERLCESDFFRCVKKKTCISDLSLCDGYDDCGDLSDEPKDKCHVNECNSTLHNCTQRCEDDTIGFHCACEHGYVLSADKFTCLNVNECSTVFGVCSGHKCFDTQGSYKCSCHEGYELVHHRYCRAKGSEVPYLVFANRHDIRKAQLKQARSGFHHYTRLQAKRSIGVDYNLRENYLVWSDYTSNSIMIDKLHNGTSTYAKKEPSILVHDIAHSWGLAVDWVHNLLYWTDEVYATISVVSVKNPKNRVTLFSRDDGVKLPRPISVNVAERFIVWADWGSHTIQRASQDGTNRKVLVNTDPEGYASVLTLDMLTKKIYWIDNRLHTLNVLNYDGSGRKTLAQSRELLPFPAAMDIFEDYIYFSDWKKDAILRINVNADKMAVKSLIEHLDNQPMSVKVIHSLKQPTSVNVCAKAKCSHLCLPTQTGSSHTSKCRCLQNFKLAADGFTCIETKATSISTSIPLVKKFSSSTTVSPFSTSSPSSSKSPKTDSTDKKSQPRDQFNRKIETASTKGNKVISSNTYNHHHDKNDDVLSTSSDLFPESDAHLAMIIGAVCVTILFLVFVLIFVIQRTYQRRHITAMNFDNPVYRKTTEEQFVLEKSEECVNSFSSSLEPLNSPGTNEFV
ncbi:low-density lipoprotein receptor-related protein 8-like [Brevipalpus obovatus]|uniref:low-density lipoprotein receptor-related protein 8-like n=1 Tax=Brevipalpus obovatus TaxID=246614 RepID=UPI003D9F468D